MLRCGSRLRRRKTHAAVLAHFGETPAGSIVRGGVFWQIHRKGCVVFLLRYIVATVGTARTACVYCTMVVSLSGFYSPLSSCCSLSRVPVTNNNQRCNHVCSGTFLIFLCCGRQQCSHLSVLWNRSVFSRLPTRVTITAFLLCCSLLSYVYSRVLSYPRSWLCFSYGLVVV